MDAEQRGRVVDRGEAGWIAGLARSYQFDADPSSGFDLAPSLVFGGNPPRPGGAPRRASSGSRSSAARAEPK